MACDNIWFESQSIHVVYCKYRVINNYLNYQNYAVLEITENILM